MLHIIARRNPQHLSSTPVIVVDVHKVTAHKWTGYRIYIQYYIWYNNAFFTYIDSSQNSTGPQKKRRGLGTDVACVCGMNFLSQIIVSAVVGVLVDVTGSELTIIIFALGNGFMGAFLAAVFVVYKLPEDGPMVPGDHREKHLEGSESSSSGSTSSDSAYVSAHLKAGVPERELTGPVWCHSLWCYCQSCIRVTDLVIRVIHSLQI